MKRLIVWTIALVFLFTTSAIAVAQDAKKAADPAKTEKAEKKDAKPPAAKAEKKAEKAEKKDAKPPAPKAEKKADEKKAEKKDAKPPAK